MLARLIISTIALTSILSCEPKSVQRGNVLATAYKNKLYQSEVEGLINESLTRQDSQKLINKYIDQWLMDEILYNKAQQNVKATSDIDNLVESYRKSLYILEYEKEIFAERSSDTITQAALDTFYARNKAEYALQEDLVQLLLVKVPEKYDDENLKTLWKTENIPALKAFLKSSEGFGYLDIEKWYPSSQLKQLMPSSLYNKINFSKQESYSTNDRGNRFLIKILARIKADEEPPQSFIMPKIRQRILNEKSSEYLNNFKKDLYQNNIQSKDIIIHYAQ